MPIALKSIDRPQLEIPVSAISLPRAILFCAGATLLAVAIYVIVFHGFNAVVRCEVDSYNFMHQTRTAISEIASINGCGF
jgi:hypothetical protein